MLQPTFFAALVAATASFPPPVATIASFPTPPPSIRLRISVTSWAPKAFLATAFLMLGRHNVVPECYTGTACTEEWARGGCAWAVHVHGTWSMVFASHQDPGSLIPGRGWRCPTVGCGWSSVTLGPAFELVTLQGGIRRRRGSRSLNWSWSRWRGGQDSGTRQRCINLHCRWARHLKKLM